MQGFEKSIHTTLLTMLLNKHHDNLAASLLHANLTYCHCYDFPADENTPDISWIIEIDLHWWLKLKNDGHAQHIVTLYLEEILRDSGHCAYVGELTFRLKLSEENSEWHDGVLNWFYRKLKADLHQASKDPAYANLPFNQFIKQYTKDFFSGPLIPAPPDHTVCEQRIAELQEQLDHSEAERLIAEAQAQVAQTNHTETFHELERIQALLSLYEAKRERCDPYMREKALAFAEYRCMADPEHTENLQIDRVIPGVRGGKYTWDNIQVLCQWCNKTKHDHIGEGWDFRTPEFREMCENESDSGGSSQQKLFA